MDTHLHNENSKDYSNEQKIKLNIEKKEEGKKQTNGNLFIIIMVAIVGFFLFREIGLQEKIKQESRLVTQTDDNSEIEMQGIDILDISTITIDGNKNVIVKAFDGTKQKDITPDEIKVVTSGVTWIGKKTTLFVFKHYTLYITKEEYSALQEMLSLNNGGI